uniref:STAS domain-containing protein n=1 Tax=Zooxanthella nutricula TaxID=1333877 RepID=A0A7S2PKC6_9DINO
MEAKSLEKPFMGYSSDGKHRRGVWASVKAVMPILDWLPYYPVRESLLPDVSGGLTLGAVLMGQSLAHADLCKVNLINGPYSCIMPPIVYSMFGTCLHASVGTGGLVSLLTGEQLAQYGDDIDFRTHVGSIMTLEVGLFIFLMGVCKLAFLVRFLSRPALSGFITASAYLIMLSQVVPMLGLPAWVKGGIVSVVRDHVGYLWYLNHATTVLSVLCLAFLMNAKRLKKVKALKFVSDFKELLLMAATCVFAKYFNAQVAGSEGYEWLQPIKVIGPMPSGLPGFSMPLTLSRDDLRLAKEVLPGAIMVALVVFISSFAAAKKFSMKGGYQVKAFNELVGLGLANVVGAANGAVPTQVGLSRCGIAYQCGVQSQLGSGILVAAVVAACTAALSGYLYHVPKCVLNCIIVNGASHLPELDEGAKLWTLFRDPRFNWKSRMEFTVWFGAFCCSMYFGAFIGMAVAVVVSLGLILYQVVNPEITELGYRAADGDNHARGERARKWMNLKHHQSRREDRILVCRLEGPLFYANVDSLQEYLDDMEVQFQEETGDAYKGIILSAAAIPFIDTTATSTLQEMIKSYSERRILFFIANTFGQAGRFVSDKIEESMEKELTNQSDRDYLKSCSTVDDFVELIRRHHSGKCQALQKVSVMMRSGSQYKKLPEPEP